MRRISAVWLVLLVLWTAPSLAAPVSRPITWKVDTQTFSGVLVHDDASNEKRPGLLMVPDWLGVTKASVEKAGQIAGDDYVVLVVDMYGKNIRPKNPAQALAQVKKLYVDPLAMRARMNKALEVLRTQAGKAPVDTTRIAAFGYCFGGSSVLELARSGADIAGVISFHGGLDTAMPATRGAIKAPLLILNGADDRDVAPNIPAFEKEMNAAGADWQFVNFSGAVHCFALETANSPPGCLYNERAAIRAYRMMDSFLGEVFAR